MREIQIKIATSGSRKSLSIIELVNKDGDIGRAEKRFVYRVRRLLGGSEFDWLDKTMPTKIKALKRFDFDHGRDGFRSVTIGHFLLIQNETLFQIIFSHKMSIVVSKETEKSKGFKI